jgi:integrase
MAKILTDVAIRNLKPESKPYELPDGAARGLRVAVYPTGRKSFIVRYRNAAGRTRKLTLQPGVTLAAARKLAADALLEVAQGRDPGEQKQAAKEASVTSKRDHSVARWAAAFIERHAEKKRESTLRQIKHVFDDIITPAWGGRTVHDIKRRDIVDLVEGLAEAKPVMANRVQAWLSRFFKWLIERDVIEASPCVGVARPSEEQARDRCLSDAEIRAIWRACAELDKTDGACVQTMILLGQRRGEIAGMRRSEIDGDLWTIPAGRMKGKQAHTIPLPKQVQEIVKRMPRIGDGDLVFTATGKRPLEHFDRIKVELDAHARINEPWRLHDIRRSVASGMPALNIAIPVIEKILAHRKGTFSGIVGVYQRHSFVPEMRAALQKWADHVEHLVTGKRSKVVPFPKAG